MCAGEVIDRMPVAQAIHLSIRPCVVKCVASKLILLLCSRLWDVLINVPKTWQIWQRTGLLSGLVVPVWWIVNRIWWNWGGGRWGGGRGVTPFVGLKTDCADCRASESTRKTPLSVKTVFAGGNSARRSCPDRRRERDWQRAGRRARS